MRVLPELTPADLMKLLNEALHEALTGNMHVAPSTNGSTTPLFTTHIPDPSSEITRPMRAIKVDPDLTEESKPLRSTDTAQIRKVVAQSPTPQKLTRADYDYPDDF